MSKRKVHLRLNQAINVGHTQTRCGIEIRPRWNPLQGGYDTADVVNTFNTSSGRLADVTVHGTLVTCVRCVDKMKGF